MDFSQFNFISTVRQFREKINSFTVITSKTAKSNPPTDNFWTVNLAPTNYISLEEEFNSNRSHLNIGKIF